jgi:hypothetical protein
MLTKIYLQKFAKIDKELLAQDADAYLDLEFDTKISLNNLFLLIIHNYEDDEFKKEISYGMYSIELNSFLTIKLSLDLAIVPIK